jgi:hypothetical protein
MQSYFNCGYGFSGELLSNEEFDAILNHMMIASSQNIGLRFISFSEDITGQNNGSVVLLPLGEVTHYGKFATSEQILHLLRKYNHIPEEILKEMHELLDNHGLTRLKDEIQLIFYMDNY